MKRLILFFLLLSILGFLSYQQVRQHIRNDLKQIVAYPSPTVYPTQGINLRDGQREAVSRFNARSQQTPCDCDDQ